MSEHPRVVEDDVDGGIWVLRAEAETPDDARKVAAQDVGYGLYGDVREETLTLCTGHPEYDEFYAVDPAAWEPPLVPTGEPIPYWKVENDA